MTVNRLSWQTFLVLVIGFFLLFSSAFFIVSAYWTLTRSHLTPNRLSRTITRSVNLAKVIQPEQLKTSIRLFSHPGVHLRVLQHPPKNTALLTPIARKIIHQQVLKNPDKVRLVFALGHQHYLYVRTHIIRPLPLKLQFGAALLVWLMAFVGFCYFIVRQLSLPLGQFIKGVTHFSNDINAPPLPETGPKIIRPAFAAFNRMQQNLKQLLQSRTQMLAAISHDLRTPITRLQLRLENLPASKTTHKMQQDLQQMETMIQSILSFVQHEREQEPKQTLDLNALLQSICDDLHDLDKPVNFEEAPQRVLIAGRSLGLRRAFENLINNAIKYGYQAQVRLKVHHRRIHLSILDDGPGIPESELENVFLPFYRVDKARQSSTGGSGLGLASAQDIIHSHGGSIQLTNLKPRGLIVTVILPYKE